MKRARNGEKEVLSRRELYGLGMDRSFKVRSVTYCNVGQYGAGLQWPAVPEVLCYVLAVIQMARGIQRHCHGGSPSRHEVPRD
ncbi:unnamed protein product [Lasius platythorax]|uniref:Uncharacterized protein n=1 Tax=Lasius platythorax TaxID=488582 RepID=A0AAV2N6G5_9HYME